MLPLWFLFQNARLAAEDDLAKKKGLPFRTLHPLLQESSIQLSASPRPAARRSREQLLSKEGSAYPLIILTGPGEGILTYRLPNLGHSITHSVGLFKRTIFNKPLNFEKNVKKVSVWLHCPCKKGRRTVVVLRPFKTESGSVRSISQRYSQ